MDKEAGVRVGVGNRGRVLRRDLEQGRLCTSHLTSPQRQGSVWFEGTPGVLGGLWVNIRKVQAPS